jgi:predicted ArsR family transcriptional regulator
VVGKVMSHPARVAILLRIASEGTASPKAAAGATSIPLGTCSYHMSELRTLGVVRLRSTRRVRGTDEHIYELTSAGRAALRAIESVQALAPRR